MTQDEEIISNTSYCSLDFRSIYPELLDTAKKLTNKWDPSLSNESDPGNILIKEAAIVGDKVNYHIDKNVLECFPLSATQQSSARQLYDLVGYDMHWYQSAEGNITFKLLKPTTSINPSLNYFRIVAGTVVSDTTGEYVYTLTQPTDFIQNTNTIYTAPAIQGTINPYEINGDSLITLNNLDENLRLYFPQNIIAENGIYVFTAGANNSEGYDPTISGFINNVLDEEGSTWMLVDNLTKYPAGSKVFKFGLDLNSDNCYIQFPEDVANLIGSGLNIYYTTTLGQEGNIKNSIISKLLSDYPVKIKGDESVVINKYVVVSNTATIGGADPETLQEAYRNYKKLIGTYDTLVTKRDYENAIYNLRDSDNSNSLISNALVTDRTSDMNYSQKVIETNLDTDYARNYVVQDTNQDIMMPYDIALYLLKAPESMLTIDNYNTSFNPDLSGTTKLIIEDDLDELKSVQHNLYYIPKIGIKFKTREKSLKISNIKSESDLYFNINNICRLTGTLTTYYKVSKSDASEIEANVIKALITNYNARAIDFGNQLDFDDLITTIKNADDRIRNVSLNTPTYEPTMIFADSSSQSLYAAGEHPDPSDLKNNDNINRETLAKMILAGKVQLFSFQDDFQFDFGQTNGKVYSGLSTITTRNPITVEAVQETFDLNTFDGHATELNTNDIFQIVTPNLVSEASYSAAVSFAANFPFAGKKPYKLKGDEKIKFVYLDTTTAKKKAEIYGVGTIIRSIGGAQFTQEDENKWNRETAEDQWSRSYTGTRYMKQLTVGQSIEIVKPSEITVEKGTPYYIISKNIYNDTYRLEVKKNEATILTENEYLIYTNSDLDGLVILGAGTSLKSKTLDTLVLQSKILSLEEVMSTEIDDATHIWNTLDDDLIASENTVVSLTAGDQVLAISDTLTEITSGNTLSTDPAIKGFLYKFKDSDSIEELNIPDDSSINIYYRSNMVLTGNSVVAQKLVDAQEIDIQGNTLTAGKSLLYSYPVNFVGGGNINVEVLNETTGGYENLLSIYAFDDSNVTDIEGITRENGLLTISATDFVSKLNYTFNSTSTSDFGYRYYLLPTALIIPDGAEIILSVDNHGTIGKFIDNYNQQATYSYSVEQTENSILTISASQDINDIDITMGYKYILNGNDLTIQDSDTTVFTKNTIPNLNTNGSTLTYDSNGQNELLFTYDNDPDSLTYGLYKSSADGLIKVIPLDASSGLIVVKDSSDKLKDLTLSMNSITATFGYMQQITGLNSEEINSENIAGNYYKFDIEGSANGVSNFNGVISKIEDILNTLPSKANYDWAYKVPAENKVLYPLAGESYFNKNHIYNQCTIAKIDFSGSSIKVNPASIK